MGKGRRRLLETGIAIKRSVEDSSYRGHENRKQEEIKRHHNQTEEQSGVASESAGDDHQADAGQHEHQRNKAEAEAANDFFSPSVTEEFRGAFYGIDRGKVFEGQYRNHEVAGQRPGDADNPHDNAA